MNSVAITEPATRGSQAAAVWDTGMSAVQRKEMYDTHAGSTVILSALNGVCGRLQGGL